MSYKNPIPKVDDEVSNGNGAFIGFCQFCGKENVVVIGTSVTDCYCKECLNNALIEIKIGIKRIDEFTKTNNLPKVKSKQKVTKEEFAELDKLKDEALAKLMSGKYY